MPPGGHLRPLGGGFLITVAAHKCGLHHQHPDGGKHTGVLCLSAQMRIASHGHAETGRAGRLCLSAQMRIASRWLRPGRYDAILCLSAQMRIASAILHKKCDILFCRLRCESVDSFSGITKDACADYFPVLFYCQGNQRCHYRQSRTDNRPVFYGANCTGFFCKLLLRTYARMLLRIPILESVFGISDNLRID